MEFWELDWELILFHLQRIAIAYALALPIGWERERSDGGAGLRTFPLVAVASCGFVLTASALFGHSPDSQARVIQGVITGMGFIGGGAILKQQGSVSGTATAASIWNTGAVGTAVALGRIDIGVMLSVFNFLTLRLLLPFKERFNGRPAPPRERIQD